MYIYTSQVHYCSNLGTIKALGILAGTYKPRLNYTTTTLGSRPALPTYHNPYIPVPVDISLFLRGKDVFVTLVNCFISREGHSSRVSRSGQRVPGASFGNSTSSDPTRQGRHWNERETELATVRKAINLQQLTLLCIQLGVGPGRTPICCQSPCHR